MTLSDARLIAHGRLPWDEARTHLTGCTCLWADLDGVHADTAPADAPIASHLWGWDEQRLLRARIDNDECVLAELDLTHNATGEPVQVTQRRIPTWPPDEGRVSVDERWRGRSATLYEVTGLMPLTFARLDPT
jgi:hypothetical protein